MRNKVKTRGRSRKNGKDKEFEVNIPDKSVNLEDLASVVKDSKIGRNDPSWYAQSPALLRDSASFPFSWPVGAPTNFDLVPFGTVSKTSQVAESIPGIMAINFSPTIGVSKDQTSPINIAARQIYSFVRHANSGHANYDSPDLMMYLIAMDSAYMWLSYMTRVYGTAMVYSTNNRYLPKALLKVMNANFDDVHSNLAQLRFYINEFAYKIASLCVPAGMSYFTRHAWMCSNVYLDSNSSKGQMYVFVPASYYVFREQVNGPAYLTARSTQVSGREIENLTVNDMVEIGKEILEPILSSEDMNIMSGDILKAFGGDNLMKVSPIDEAYTVEPIYVEEVLTQIENAVAVGHGYSSPFGSSFPSNPGPNDITQSVTFPNEGAILQSFKTQFNSFYGGTSASPFKYTDAAGTGWLQRKKINFHTETVTPEMMMVATRMSNMIDPIAGSDGKWSTANVLTSGSEIIHSFQPYQLVKGEPVFNKYLNEIRVSSVLDLDQFTESIGALFNIISDFAQFDWAPGLIGMKSTSDGTDTFSNYWGDTLDTDNYSLLTVHDFERMNETALLSMFSVPQMAALSAKPTSSR